MPKIKNIKKIGNFISAILLGNTKELIARIDERTEFLLKDMSEIKPKVNDMSPKVDILWKNKTAPANSPRQLNDYGNKILNESGIKEIVDDNKEKLLSIVREKKPDNPYDAENIIEKVMEDLPEYCPEVMPRLKNGAFAAGTEIITILFVGSIYLRNLIFNDLGFKIEEIDNYKSDKK